MRLINYGGLKYHNWLLWYKSHNSDKKLFILLCLFFPAINLFWDVSVPGFGMPVTQLFSGLSITYFSLYIISNPFNLKSKSSLLNYLKIFCSLFLFKSFYLIFFHPSMNSIELSMRNLSFVIFLLMMLRVVQNEDDFIMIMRTYFYSHYVIILNYFFMFSVGNARTARGYVRNTYGYYDVTNVSVQSVMIILIAIFFYFYIKEKKINPGKYFYFEMLGVIIISLLLIKNTFHIMSYLLTVVIFLMYLIFRIKKLSEIFISILIATIIFISNFDIFSSFLEVIVNDVETIMSGVIPTTLFHGRVFYWLQFYETVSNLSFFKVFFGTYKANFATTHAHNDFIRIFASVGILGLLVYLAIIFKIFVQSFEIVSPSVRWLGFTIFFILIIYSLTIGITAYTFFNIPLCAFLVYLIKNKIIL